MRVLVTGGAGFIGSAYVRYVLSATDHDVMVFDALTYAAVPDSLVEFDQHSRYAFIKGDISDASAVSSAVRSYQPHAILHLAAESHVDRSIAGPATFIKTNIVGTYVLLEQTLAWWATLSADDRTTFRFHHVSTDEVFGSLGPTGRFDEKTAYDPRSPYAASKASSDHLVRAWGHTYGLPVLVSNCSNNYGPRQFPEKLIPILIARALTGAPMPIYGDGEHSRDWLFVEDHVRALQAILSRGQPGATYAVGGGAELTTLQVAQQICAVLDALKPRLDGMSYTRQIAFVADRLGHDRRYAIDSSRTQSDLGWRPTVSFEDGLERTVIWYLENEAWWHPHLEG